MNKNMHFDNLKHFLVELVDYAKMHSCNTFLTENVLKNELSSDTIAWADNIRDLAFAEIIKNRDLYSEEEFNKAIMLNKKFRGCLNYLQRQIYRANGLLY